MVSAAIYDEKRIDVSQLIIIIFFPFIFWGKNMPCLRLNSDDVTAVWKESGNFEKTR